MDRPTFDGSGQGGDAKAHYGWWTGRHGAGAVKAGDGTGGNVSIAAGRAVPNGDFKMSGKGGNAVGNAGGAAKGGDGKGGSFTFS
ncbi:hypothetical protein DL764_001331 [Monosporascus ibericus]|uniref:Uncharacterized protein n=1 Tax=Monosporascus ibericus TaxID=155417 RepID=A0A4V1XCD3_9PEZI|nr:hypothetical protein DL764_001331 [Monosporascus ibericus]